MPQQYRTTKRRKAVPHKPLTAEEKAYKLLLKHLSCSQKKMEKEKGYFEVVGNDTGKKYYIGRFCSYNVRMVGGIRAYCFYVHKGGQPVTASDQRLAQKILLENDEYRVMDFANTRD